MAEEEKVPKEVKEEVPKEAKEEKKETKAEEAPKEEKKEAPAKPAVDVTDKALEAVEAAKATGKLRKGTNEVTKAVEKGQAKLVLYAKDANPKEIVMHIPILCSEKSVPCVEVPTKEELGAAAGITVGSASVAVVNEGNAKNLIKEIALALKR